MVLGFLRSYAPPVAGGHRNGQNGDGSQFLTFGDPRSLAPMKDDGLGEMCGDERGWFSPFASRRRGIGPVDVRLRLPAYPVAYGCDRLRAPPVGTASRAPPNEQRGV